jgi:hypothetical protein
MDKKRIALRIDELKSMKLPLLNKRSRAYMDWKIELDKLTNLLNKTK